MITMILYVAEIRNLELRIDHESIGNIIFVAASYNMFALRIPSAFFE